MLKRLLVALIICVTGFAIAALTGSADIASLTSGAHAANKEPLSPEMAFQVSVRPLDEHTLEARWQIADGYYLYRDKMHFSSETAGIAVVDISLPAGQIKDDPNFGKMAVYHNSVIATLPLMSTTAIKEIKLKLVYQGCAEMGICYPPQTHLETISLTPEAIEASMRNASRSPDNTLSGGDETSRIASLLQGSLAWALLSFFGFGLLLAFTPCMLPMVPILSGIIVNHGHSVSHGRAFLLSLAYVLGMAVTYALAGVAAGYSGTLISAALQNAWVLGGFALVFVALALAMFGFYELQLPAGLQARLSQNANQQGGSLHALFWMGAISSLIIGPCIAAPLAGALLYIAKTGDAALGGMALFALALGMGAPLLIVGLFSRSILPKPGPWMEAVKKFFGLLLLATAFWLISSLLPSWLMLLGWAALLIVPAIYLHATDPLPARAKGWAYLWKGIGVVMLLAGAALVAGAFGGATDPLKPLAFLGKTSQNNLKPLPFERIRTVAELDARLKSAGHPVMLDFYADWCVSCKEMERDTFQNPKIRSRLQTFTLLQVDVTNNSADDQALLKRFGLYGPPGTLFFDQHGEEVRHARLIGYQPAEQFLYTLTKALSAP